MSPFPKEIGGSYEIRAIRRVAATNLPTSLSKMFMKSMKERCHDALKT